MAPCAACGADAVSVIVLPDGEAVSVCASASCAWKLLNPGLPREVDPE